jgi:hypothetical protein
MESVMFNDLAPLRFVANQSPVRLRELTGHDERAVTGTATADALALLDRLIVPRDDPRLQAVDLVAADRDCLLAAVCLRAFGDRIDRTLDCDGCRRPFDISFSLPAVLASVEPTRHPGRLRPSADNVFEGGGGRRFRLPTGRDEQRATRLPPEEAEAALLRCCAVGDSSAMAPEELQALLTETAPLVDLELAARCPDCGQIRQLHFDVQSHLLASLLDERTRLLTEVHRLALAYGWSLEEILSLRRSERRLLVEWIDNNSTRGRGPRL